MFAERSHHPPLHVMPRGYKEGKFCCLLGVVRLNEICDIEMQVRGNIYAFLFVAVNGQNLNGQNILAYRLNIFDSALLGDFFQCYFQQVLFAVRMAAEPCPGIVYIVIRKQYF